MMTIASGENLKGVQEIMLPGDVVTLNVFYWKADFAVAQVEEDVCAAMLDAMESIYTEIVGSIVDGATMGELRCYVRRTLHWDLIGTVQPDVTFLSTGEMLPHGVSALMRGYTEKPRTIGRKYLPGFSEETQVDGVIGSTTLTALAAAADRWGWSRVVTTNNDIDAGVWSTVSLNVETFTGVFVVPVNHGYQRRRRPGAGM